MLIRLLLNTKSFRRTLLNHFICKVVHDLFSFQVLANGPRFRQLYFGCFFCLICYCTCAETATVVLLALTLYKLKFSVPDFLCRKNDWKLDHDFIYFWAILCSACAETARILLPVKFLTPNLTSAWAISCSNTNFGGASAMVYTCFERKNGFCNATFSAFGGWWGWRWPFLTKLPKGTSLADFTRFEPLRMQIRSGVFLQAWPRRIGDTKKSHSEVIFHLFSGSSPLNQI